jgi:hypothetical protein
MDVGENVVYSTPLKVNNGPQIEARGAWTATCTRCMAPAWLPFLGQYLIYAR